MLRLYGEVAKTAFQRAVRSWLAALAIPIYALLYLLFASLLGPALLGIPYVGGLIIGIFGAACFGGYLSVLGKAVEGSPIRLSDLKDGLRAVWDVVSVLFIIMIINVIVAEVTAGNPSGIAVRGVVALAMAIFFNLLPELICHSQNRSVALLQESAEFVLANPVSWFAPNLAFAAIFLWATGNLSLTSAGENLVMLANLGTPTGALSLVAGAGWKALLLIPFLHYVMIFRGLLYLELSSGSSRMRAFRRRMS